MFLNHQRAFLGDFHHGFRADFWSPGLTAHQLLSWGMVSKSIPFCLSWVVHYCFTHITRLWTLRAVFKMGTQLEDLGSLMKANAITLATWTKLIIPVSARARNSSMAPMEVQNLVSHTVGSGWAAEIPQSAKCQWQVLPKKPYWLVVSTPLKNIS